LLFYQLNYHSYVYIHFFRYIVTELCHGTLKDQVQNTSGLDNQLILGQITLGLNYLHANNIIHKNLKPSNILYQNTIFDFCLYKLSGFGFSSRSITESPNGMPTNEIESRDYMSPELMRSEEPSFESDMWALGIVCFYVLSSGEHPYRINNSTMFRHLFIKELLFPPAIEKIINSWAATDLVCRLLHFFPERRPSSFVVLYHPYFIHCNEKAQVLFSTKIIDFSSTCDGNNRLRMSQLYSKQSVLSWYRRYGPGIDVRHYEANITVNTLVNK
jgi:p90 ribosomal S6 kinase